MLVQFLNAPEFSLAENGVLTRTARWLLCAEADDGDFALAAMLWAGQVNDDWRVPNADGDGYGCDPGIRIAKVDCKVIDSRSCEIHYTGLPRVGAVTRAPGAYRFERRANLEEYQFDSFDVPAALLHGFLPAVGAAVTWNHLPCLCESVSAELQSDGGYRVHIVAVNTAIRADGEITTERNVEFEYIKQGVWLVAPEALELFLENNHVHQSAAHWAGAGFYIFHAATAPFQSGNRTRVTLQARYVELQLIETKRTEQLASIGNSEMPEKEVVWTGRWRVAPDDRAIFSNQLGAGAEAWAEEGFIVSRITPERISDCEYEYTLEARLPETIVPDRIAYWRDRDLPHRQEFYARVGELRLTAAQCGYCWNYQGQHVRLANWSPALQCPLVTAQPLDRRWINQGVRLLEIVGVNYISGPSSGNMSTISNWLNTGRVVRATLAGITDNWLKVDLKVDDIVDSRDRRWTKITKVYRQAPGGKAWNTSYWV